MNLRKTAQHAPHCMNPECMLPNPDGNLLCLAHSNELRHGRGSHHKTPDIMGAILCHLCHARVDGQAGKLSKDEKREMHRLAHDNTLLWWVQEGYVKVAA